MLVNNLYLAQLQTNHEGQWMVEYRLVWAESEIYAVMEVYSLYSDEKTKPDGELLDVTVSPAIGKMVR